ncbi:amidohydrolase [Liquorilactobacillus mali]|uniref:amidohydrolase n=1 Tax=Liquorilactobacillus mali TaxID=1618 RepID=UPI00234FEE6D|nr:amidohydrolase [Liquorilactobacillus mali]MDC7952877.1 amidohydrolase [Liquorilactobacillus mali]
MNESNYLRAINTFKLLHQHPELSNHEEWTTNFIKKRLTQAGIKVLDYKLETGVVARIDGNNSNGHTIALRADIDGLPIKERTGLEYSSLTDGIAHACGHDFHSAALLEAAEILNKNKENLNGNVILIFEPGEENHSGARMMVDAGVLNGVSAIFGMHNMPFIPCGTLALKAGPLMASNDNFQVTVKGRSSHAAMPHTGRDPIVAAANMITAIQTLVSRFISPFDTNIVSIGMINGGTANNVIPNNVNFKGTIRTFSEKTRSEIKRQFEMIIRGIASAYDQKVDILWDKGPSSVNNNQELTSMVKEVGKKFMSVVDAVQTCADDDFATYEEMIPGCYAFIGSKGLSNLHHDDFAINLDGLRFAIDLHVKVAQKLLM